jgi:small subunit ribosomal protein S9
MPRKKVLTSEEKEEKENIKEEKENINTENNDEINETNEKEIDKMIAKDEKKKEAVYYEGVGSRKTAVARVRLYTKNKEILINGKDYKNYFSSKKMQSIIEAPFEKMKCLGKFGLTANVKGGGLSAQAEAVRLGISRALVVFNSDFKKRLRRAGYLTRDPRMVERKKYGLKKARKSPQWAKR